MKVEIVLLKGMVWPRSFAFTSLQGNHAAVLSSSFVVAQTLARMEAPVWTE